MSATNEASTKKNKKERRKLQRALAQQTGALKAEDSHDEIVTTTTLEAKEKHEAEQPSPLTLYPAVRDLTISSNESTMACSVTQKSESVDQATPGRVHEQINEDLDRCSAKPTTGRPHRLKRFPVKSAIPVPNSQTDIYKLPPRPPTGTQGEPIQIYCNHFPARVHENLTFYQYDVLVEKVGLIQSGGWEEVFSRDQRREFVQALAAEGQLDFVYWYDEGKSLYSIEKLTKNQLPKVFQLKKNSMQRIFRFTIIDLAATWSTSSIFNYLRSKTSESPVNVIRVLEILLKQALQPIAHCEGSLFYRNKPEPDRKLPDGFELRVGFFQSLHLTQTGLTLNLQTTLTKFYPAIDVLDFICHILNKDVMKHGMTNHDYDRVATVLNGCKITTRQSNYTQLYQIRGFSDIAEREKFIFSKEIVADQQKKCNKIEYNLIEYYQKEKGITLQYPKLRCLKCFFLHERKNPKQIPIELCRVLHWQECERESAAEQRDRQNLSIPSPEQRYDDIMESLHSCQYRAPAKLPLCRVADFSVADFEMKEIKGRILPPPIINDNRAEIKMGRINLQGNFIDPIRIEKIAFVFFHSSQNAIQKSYIDLLEKFINSFAKMCNVFRMGPIRTVKKDLILIVNDSDASEHNTASIDKYFNDRKKENHNLVVCIMESLWPELRQNIKVNGTVNHGIVTQCVMYSKLQEQIDKFNRTKRGSPDRILDNMCENILRKINFKMQGVNTQVKLPTNIKSLPQNKLSKSGDLWQFMGADVIHPVCRQDKPSIAAVVGSGDSLCSTSAVRVCKQWPKEGKCSIEAIVELQVMVGELLEYYREWNGQLPNKIVFYRDGVDDGQFARILNFEIPQIKNAFREIYQNQSEPLLTFIVVKKRHHTRFFSLDNQKRTINIPSGLVVDTDIVHPKQFSFFLNSHRALQGTNRPALYHVLYDEIKFTADELQLLTYYLCFTDPRSSTSEAIPSLVHQADLAASNARDLFPERDSSTNDGYAPDALEDPSLDDIMTEHLRVHENMRDTPHFG